MNAISTSPIRTFAALCSVAVLGFGATGCMGATGMSPAMTQQASAMHHFSMAVHMGEIEEAQLALSRTQNAQVRAFAQQMVNDHSMGMQMEEQMAMSMHMDDMGGGSSMQGRSSMVGTGTTTTGGGDPLAANGGAARQTSSGSGGSATASAGGGMAMPMDAEHMQRMRAELASNPASRPVVEDHMRGMQMLQGLSGAQFDQAYMTRQVGLHRYTLEQMDRMMGEMNMGMGASGGSMDHGSMTSTGATSGGMNAGAVTMGTREGMMAMHMQERQMVAMHLQQAQQIVSSLR
jgi:predicted outer membrane protein